MKSNQFCSVCKQWLDMEVVPTGDDDDGVIWFRCPQCQGFLPKLGVGLAGDSTPGGTHASDVEAADNAGPAASSDLSDAPEWDSPAAMMAGTGHGKTAERSAESESGDGPELDDLDLDALDLIGSPLDVVGLVGVGEDGDDDEDADGDEEPVKRPPATAVPVDPIPEYAALLAEADAAAAVPYRPWENYQIGQCILHLAWDDCGIVVGKEMLPGGRQTIKCYFETAGVVRLIENAPQ